MGLFLSAVTAWADPYSFTSPLSKSNTDDTYISEKFLNTNYGGADSLKSGGNAMRNRALIQYATPIIPGGGTVISAILHIPVRRYKGSGLETTAYAIHGMTGGWDADYATWTMADSSKSWSKVGGDYDTTTIASFVVSDKDSIVSVDLTSLVAGWIASPATNKGIMIRATSEPGVIVIDPEDLGFFSAISVHKLSVFESSDQTVGPPYFVFTVLPPDDVLPPVTSAIGEVVPHLLPRGGPATFDLLVQVTMQGRGYDTGFDRITVPLPSGLENIKHIETMFDSISLSPLVGGSSNSLVLDLSPPINTSGVLQISFEMEAPGADTAETFSLPPTLDDTQTLFLPMSPSPGDVDGKSNGNHMRVTVPGLLSSMDILPALDSISSDTTITFTANGYDNEGNAVPTNVSWSVESLIASLDPLSGVFDPLGISTGYVFATDGAVVESLYTHIIPGRPIGFAIAPPDTSLTMDETVDFVSIAIDSDFNWYQPATTWSVVNTALATIDTSGLLTPSIPGSTSVIGTFSGWSDTSSVMILPGGIASINVDPMSATITALQQIQFQATALDARGNEINDPGTYTWAGGSLIGNIGPTSGLFDATTSGKDVIRVSYKKPNVINTEGEIAVGATIVGFSDSITVLPGPASSVTIAPGSTSLGIGGGIQFTYQALDSEGNDAAESPAWSSTGGIGTVNGSGLFTATTPGSGLVIVTVGAVSDTASVEVLDNEGLVIEAVLETRDRVTQGESGLPVRMALRNESGDDIDAFSFNLTFEGPLGEPLNAEYTIDSIMAPFDTLPNGASDTVSIAITVDSLATIDTPVTIRGFASGSFTSNGSPVQTDASTATGEWTATEPPVLVDLLKTLFPKTAIPGGSSGFFLGVQNIGGADLDLDSTSCLVLTDGSDSLLAPITGTTALAADSSIVSLLFDPASLPGTFLPGDYQASLVLSGFDGNGAAFSKSVTTMNNSLAVLPPHVQAEAIPVDAGAVYPGSTAIHLLSVRFTNLYPDARTLTSVAFANDASQIGSIAQRDAVFDAIAVYHDADRSSDLTPGDIELTNTTFSNGRVVLSGLNFVLAPSDSLYLLLTADLSVLSAPSGFALDAVVSSESEITFSPSATVLAVFPLDSPGNSIVDGSIAAQIPLDAGLPEELPAGSVDSLTFSFQVPSNGFLSDTLFSITLKNRGEANTSDLAELKLWRDGGNGSFDRGAGDDSLLGTAAPAGNNWFWGTSGLYVPTGGARLFASVSVVEAPSGGVLQLSIPEGGLQYNSTNDGPIDTPAYTSTLQIIGGSQGVAIADFAASGISTVYPGEADVKLYSLTLANLDTTEATVSSLLLRNASRGKSGADSVLSAVHVVDDSSGLVFGSAGFTNAGAMVTLQSLTIPASSERRIAIAVDAGESCASQGDSIAVVIDSGGAFGFPEERVAIGTFPIERSTFVSVRALRSQNFAIPNLEDGAMIPGESGRLAFQVRVPSNGCLTDTLTELQIDNFGTAVRLSDIANVSITTAASPDGGIALFGAGDRSWFRNDLAIPVLHGGMDLYVWVEIDPGASGETTIALEIPVNGVSLASGRIGPGNLSVASPALFTITTAPIFAQFIEGGVSVVSTGQPYDVTFEISNPSVADTMHSIFTPGLTTTGGTITEIVSPVIDINQRLAPGEKLPVTWTIHANSGGTMQVQTSFGGKPVGSEEVVSTGIVTSSIVTVQVPADSMTLDIDADIPTEIVRGSFGQELVQINVTHENGSPIAAPARLEAVTFRLDDELGNVIDPSAFLSQLDVVDLEANRKRIARLLSADFGTGAITVVLDSTIVLQSGNDADLAFEFSFREESSVQAFTIRWETAGALALFDLNSGDPVGYLLDSTVVSDTIPVVDPPAGLDVTVISGLQEQINRGDQNVVVMDFTLAIAENETQTADLLVNEIRMLPGTADFPFSRLIVEQDGFLPYFDGNNWIQADDSLGSEHVLILRLSPPIRVTSEATLNIKIRAAVREDAPLGPFHVGLDSVFVDPEPDGPPSSETSVSPVVTLVLEDPLETDIKIRTEDIAVTGTDRVDTNFVITGTRDVPAFALQFDHGTGDSLSDIEVSSIIFSVRDSGGDPVPLETVLDRARLLRNGVSIASAAPIEPGLNTLALVPAPEDLVRMASGESVSLLVEFDVRADAAAGDYVISVASEGVTVIEQNQRGNVTVSLDGEAPNAFFTGPLAVRRQSDAVDVTVSFTMPATSVAGASIEQAGTVRIKASGDATVSDVHLTSIVFQVIGDAGVTDPAQALAFARLVSGDKDCDGTFTANGILFTFADPVVLMPGVEQEFALSVELAAALSLSRFKLRIPVDEMTILEVGPVIRSTSPESDESGWTHFADRDFESSVRNYPNPFSATEEATTLAFYAREAGTAIIRIFTGLGTPVWSIELPIETPGFVEIPWSGENGDGNQILSGVYLASFEIRYGNGTVDLKTHKIAVLN